MLYRIWRNVWRKKAALKLCVFDNSYAINMSINFCAGKNFSTRERILLLQHSSCCFDLLRTYDFCDANIPLCREERIPRLFSFCMMCTR